MLAAGVERDRIGRWRDEDGMARIGKQIGRWLSDSDLTGFTPFLFVVGRLKVCAVFVEANGTKLKLLY